MNFTKELYEFITSDTFQWEIQRDFTFYLNELPSIKKLKNKIQVYDKKLHCKDKKNVLDDNNRSLKREFVVLGFILKRVVLEHIRSTLDAEVQNIFENDTMCNGEYSNSLSMLENIESLLADKSDSSSESNMSDSPEENSTESRNNYSISNRSANLNPIVVMDRIDPALEIMKLANGSYKLVPSLFLESDSDKVLKKHIEPELENVELTNYTYQIIPSVSVESNSDEDDVSSVHTSDLSSFDDEISISSNDERCGETITLKYANKLCTENKFPVFLESLKRKKMACENITPPKKRWKINYDANSMRGSESSSPRVAKPNSKYYSSNSEYVTPPKHSRKKLNDASQNALHSNNCKKAIFPEDRNQNENHKDKNVNRICEELSKKLLKPFHKNVLSKCSKTNEALKTKTSLNIETKQENPRMISSPPSSNFINRKSRLLKRNTSNMNGGSGSAKELLGSKKCLNTEHSQGTERIRSSDGVNINTQRPLNKNGTNFSKCGNDSKEMHVKKTISVQKKRGRPKINKSATDDLNYISVTNSNASSIEKKCSPKKANKSFKKEVCFTEKRGQVPNKVIILSESVNKISDKETFLSKNSDKIVNKKMHSLKKNDKVSSKESFPSQNIEKIIIKKVLLNKDDRHTHKEAYSLKNADQTLNKPKNLSTTVGTLPARYNDTFKQKHFYNKKPIVLESDGVTSLQSSNYGSKSLNIKKSHSVKSTQRKKKQRYDIADLYKPRYSTFSLF